MTGKQRSLHAFSKVSVRIKWSCIFAAVDYTERLRGKHIKQEWRPAANAGLAELVLTQPSSSLFASQTFHYNNFNKIQK